MEKVTKFNRRTKGNLDMAGAKATACHRRDPWLKQAKIQACGRVVVDDFSRVLRGPQMPISVYIKVRCIIF